MSVVYGNGIISAGLPKPCWIAVDVVVALVLSLFLCCCVVIVLRTYAVSAV